MKAEWFKGRLRELREQAGLSRQQLADLAGLKLSGIRDLEQGVNKPSWETVIALCQALSVNCDAFLQPPGDLPPPKAGRPVKSPVEAQQPPGIESRDQNQLAATEDQGAEAKPRKQSRKKAK